LPLTTCLGLSVATMSFSTVFGNLELAQLVLRALRLILKRRCGRYLIREP